MAGPFSVDHGTVRTAASDVRSTRSEVDGELNKLRGVVDDLAAAWKGQAGGTFQQLMTRWDEDNKKLLTAMDDIANLLDKSANTHQTNDDQQHQMLTKFNSALNL
jgi:WXG100 family type VII secretion target